MSRIISCCLAAILLVTGGLEAQRPNRERRQLDARPAIYGAIPTPANLQGCIDCPQLFIEQPEFVNGTPESHDFGYHNELPPSDYAAAAMLLILSERISGYRMTQAPPRASSSTTYPRIISYAELGTSYNYVEPTARATSPTDTASSNSYRLQPKVFIAAIGRDHESGTPESCQRFGNEVNGGRRILGLILYGIGCAAHGNSFEREEVGIYIQVHLTFVGPTGVTKTCVSSERRWWYTEFSRVEWGNYELSRIRARDYLTPAVRLATLDALERGCPAV